MRRQTRGTEPILAIGGLFFRGARGALALCLFQLLLQRGQLTPQARDRAAVQRIGFLQTFDFSAGFLASNALDLGFEDRGDIGHEGNSNGTTDERLCRSLESTRQIGELNGSAPSTIRERARGSPACFF